MMQLALAASLAIAAPQPAEPPFSTAAFVAPDVESSVEGPFGVLFVPRYRDPGSAQARRDAELRGLEGALDQMGAAERDVLRSALDRRLDAVRHWRQVFEVRAADPLPADARLEVLRERDLLAMEEATLVAQLAMLGAPRAPEAPAPPEPPAPPSAPPAPVAPPAAHDRVVLGGDVEIAPGERVRDAVAVGGDVIVRGVVEGDAVAFGGSVRVPASGRVLGEATSLGGSVEADDASVPARVVIGVVPAPVHLGPWARLVAWLVPALAFAGAGVLTVGVVPERVGRVAGMVEERPLATLGTGLLGVLAILAAAALFAVTIVGIPVTLVLLGVLAASWLLGLVGLCTALGERLPSPLRDAPRWTRFLVGAAVVAVLGAVPHLGPLVVAGAGLAGVGAALATRFGR
jgi:hypothetical protein